MARVLALALVVAALAASACMQLTADKARAPLPAGQAEVNAFREPAPLDSAARAASGGSRSPLATSPASSPNSAEATIPPLDRMVIANVNLSLSVENAIEAARLAERTAERHGGFVAGSNLRDSEHAREATVTVRVPSVRLSEALGDLRGIGRKVTDESRTTQDVTEEYTDIESNVRNLRATEAQVLALIERATKIDEVMLLHRELTGIRGQIERLEGRRRVLENRSDFATISVRLLESVPSGDGWSPLETLAQAAAALGRFATQFGTLAIWLVVFLPVYGPVLLAGGWLARRRTLGRNVPSLVTG
jgi:hypothetical protein